MTKKTEDKKLKRKWLENTIVDILDNLSYDVLKVYRELNDKAITPSEYDDILSAYLAEVKNDLLVLVECKNAEGWWSKEQAETELKRYKLRFSEFSKWMYGQTCPILIDGEHGYYKWDVDRYTDWQIKGVIPEWD